MTTESRPRRGVSPLELRLYIVALLGAVYTISWRAIGGQAPVTESVAQEPQRVWIDELPPDARPPIMLPAGWQRADVVQPARVVRVPSRAPRMRTRSS